jgi:hypothetical protein
LELRRNESYSEALRCTLALSRTLIVARRLGALAGKHPADATESAERRLSAKVMRKVG